ncbi:Katanin p80 WD40 repeat-containing subunit B1 [Schistosoma japonicum]|nr:Katanin p80 WD40 repeat-containing subunit B1 [Schistosoma japonicum]
MTIGMDCLIKDIQVKDCESEEDAEFVNGDVEWIEDENQPPDNSDNESADEIEVIENSMDVIQFFTPTQDDTFKLLSGHKESVFCLDFDSTGKFLASGGQDHIAIIWNATTCTIEFICQGHEDSVNCVSFSPGGDYLSTGDMAGSIRVWLRPVVGENTNEWKLLRTLEVNSDLLWVKWWISPSNAIRRVNNELPNPALLLAGDEQGHVTYWAISPIPLDETVDQRKCLTNTYSWVSSQSALDGIILSSSINTNNPRLIVLHRNGDLRIWDIKTNCILGDIKLFDKYSYLSKQYNADLEILDIIKTGDDGSVEALNCSSTHPLYAFGTVTGILGICDAKTNRIRQKWTYIDEDDGQPIGITSLCWSRYRPVFFTATNKGSIVAWCGLTGLTEKISSSSSGLLTEKLPLKVWWGHKAMILYLVLPPFCKSMEDNNNNRIESLNNKEQCIEPFLCTASDDTTVRYFSIDFA